MSEQEAALAALEQQFPQAGVLERKNWMPEGFEGHVTRTDRFSWVVVKFPRTGHGRIIELARLPQEYFETLAKLEQKRQQLEEEQAANSVLETSARRRVKDKTRLSQIDRKILTCLMNQLNGCSDRFWICNCQELAQDGRHCERHQLAARLKKLINESV